jgi:LPXTG-site transpeptidase (sortase) family protein
MKLSRINTGLLIAIIAINGYLILSPLWPKVDFWLARHDTAQRKQLTQVISTAPPKGTIDNRLVIPGMGFSEPIYDSRDQSALHKGLWRRPLTSTPDKGSNTVIIGHRFTYTNPRGVLYNLDKVHVGDELGVVWGQKVYRYKVATVQQVPATATKVEAPTDAPTLTLYTCTPLWLPKDRLVVTASLEETL